MAPMSLKLIASICMLCIYATPTSAADTPALVAQKSDATKAERVWWDKGGFSRHDFVCYAPHRESTDWNVLGHRGQGNHDPLENFIYSFKDKNGSAFAMPLSFSMIWDDRGSIMNEDGGVWRAHCPQEFVALGDFFYKANRIDRPGNDLFNKVRCVMDKYAEVCSFCETKIWDDSRSFANNDVSVWASCPSENGTCIGGFLYAHKEHESPPDIKPYCLKKDAFEEN